jgi:hypothetical protein
VKIFRPPALSNVVSGKFGMDINILKCKGAVMEGMERSVRTGFGVSRRTYGNRPGEPKTAGEGQGKGDVAITYALQSSTLFDAHAKLYGGIDLPPPVPGPGIRKRNDGFVDDVNTWAGVVEYEPWSAEHAMYTLQTGSQLLTDLNEVPGGSTAFHKCAVFLLSWTTSTDTLVIKTDMSEHKFQLRDNKGALSSIAIIRPDQTNKGLGYFMAVDVNQTMELAERMDKIQHMCTAAQSSRLSYSEAHQLLHQRLLMQTRYGLVLSQFTPKQCHPMTVLINTTFLPLMRVHRRTPRAVVWGPVSLGGLGLNTNIYNLQTQCAVGYLLSSLRWDQTIADDIICVLNAVQLASGWESPLLMEVDEPLLYLGRGWIRHVRQMLADVKAKVWVERAWVPRKQRQGDVSLMESFSGHPDLNRRTLLLANEFRIWLGVIMVSELASIKGDAIPIERIRNGSEWRATPMPYMHWPNVREPTSKHRAAFRKCLRLMLCPNALATTRTQDYQLSFRLKTWYPVRRHIQFEAYRTKEAILIRSEMGLHWALPNRADGFYHIQPEVTEEAPPLKSHPISPNYSSATSLWTRKRRSLIRQWRPPTQKLVQRDELVGRLVHSVTLVSDAAVHVAASKGAINWHIVDIDHRVRSVSKPLEVHNDSYSYRHELHGIYEGLVDTLDTHPEVEVIECHCDNEAGVLKVQQPEL